MVMKDDGNNDDDEDDDHDDVTGTLGEKGRYGGDDGWRRCRPPITGSGIH